MQIKKEFPPNYNEIAAIFDLTGKRPCFTYGDTIYNPSDGIISEDIMAHEAVHAEQQKKMGIENWWKKYLADPQFRLEQELEAYRVHYKYLLDMPRQYRRNRLKQIVNDLSSTMYGNIISKVEALKAITA